MRPARLLPALLFLAATTALGACDPLSLNPATIDNRVDSVRIWAVNGTPVSLPSGYDVTLRSRVRLDQVTTFDFVYAIAPDGGHVFLPIAAIAPTGRTTGNPGLLATTTPFDSITVAQQVGYVTNDTLRATVGQVFYLRSAVNTSVCSLGIPFYGKLEVLAFDDEERSVTFRVLDNINCGYRGLEVGLPKK
jgi:hypothetical protein